MNTQDTVQSKVTGIDARMHDYCTSDYFLGSDAEEVLAVPIWCNMTKNEFYNACKTEFFEQDGFYSDVDDSGNYAENALHAMVATMVAAGFFEQAFHYASELDCDDDIETSYAYIGLFAEYDND